MRVPGRPFLFIPLFFFPLVSLTWIPACGGRVIRVPDAGEWCRSGCHPGLLRAADSPGDRGFHGLRDVADRRSVSSGYRTGVIRVPMCLPGTVATYGWRHSGTDWCHSGTNPYIRGYLMAVSLPSDAVECGHIDGFETFCVFWVPARVFWVPAGVFLGVVWVFVGGYVVGDFVDLHLTDDEMARFHDSARIVREHCAMIADRL